MTFSQAKSKVSELRSSPLMKKLARLAQAAIIGLVCYYLMTKVSAIGWSEVVSSLPTTPWFYLAFLAMYFAFPIAEWCVYQKLWGPKVRGRFDVFLRMRIYNYAVLSYSGEAYVALWGSANIDQSKRKTLAMVKDSHILSALSSNSLTIALLILFFTTGQLEQITGANPSYPLYVAVAFFLSAVLIPLVVWFRRQILYIDGKTATMVFAIHFTRLLAVVGFQVAQWAIVMPYVPLDTWLLFLTAQYVLTRIPFLPNSDLLFAGVGLTLLSYVDAPHAVLAGLFVASGALAQILNLGIFAGLSIKDMISRNERKTDMKNTENMPELDEAERAPST
jgi:hypothetical protein